MTTQVDPQEAIQSLKATIADAVKSFLSPLGDQVVTQLLHSVGGETVKAVVSDLRQGEDGLVGRVVLFTDQFLAIAKIEDAPYQASSPLSWPHPVKWSTRVTLHPRSALSRVEVLSPEQPEAWAADWAHLTPMTRVLLHYEGLEESTIEVTSRNTRNLDALLALVCTDMKRI